MLQLFCQFFTNGHGNRGAASGEGDMGRGKSGPALGGTDRVPTDAISVPADNASEIVKFTNLFLQILPTTAFLFLFFRTN